MSTPNKLPRYVTPKGVAQYPKLNQPDTKFNPDGDYNTKIIINGKDAAETISLLDKLYAEAQEKAKKENPGKKIKPGPDPYSVNEETGEVTIAFKLKAKVTRKDGTSYDQKVALFDAKGKPLNENIGGGSVIKVSFEAFQYYTAMAGAGISLRCRAVQVIELHSYSSGGAGAFGFGEEDGYEAATPAVNNDSEAITNETDDF